MAAYHPPTVVHTTDDEISFLRELERGGKRVQLRLYRRALSHRVLTGPGMDVSREAVEKELNRILGRESAEEKKESYEELVARVASEWLGGGRLRRITQQRALAGEREV